MDPAAFPLGVAAAEPPQCTLMQGDQTSFTTLVAQCVFAHFNHIMYIYPIHFTTMGEELESYIKLQKQECLKKIKGP